MQGIRKFEVYQGRKGAGDVITASRYIKIPKSSDNGSRANAVMPGRFIVQCTAASNSEGDGSSATDSTGTPGRLFIGLCVAVTDLKGGRKDRQIIETTEEGLALYVPVDNVTFRGLEDGVGGGITDAGGFCAIILGTVSGKMDGETNYFTPMPNDELDSSTVAAGTSSNRACQLINPIGDITNTNTARRTWEFIITDAFSAHL